MGTLTTRQALDAALAAGAPRHETERLYAADLIATSEAYAVAADAPGLSTQASRHLYRESIRLHHEAGLHLDRADELEAQWQAAMARPGVRPPFGVRLVTT